MNDEGAQTVRVIINHNHHHYILLSDLELKLPFDSFCLVCKGLETVIVISGIVRVEGIEPI